MWSGIEVGLERKEVTRHDQICDGFGGSSCGLWYCFEEEGEE